MGRPFRVLLSGDKVYACGNCRTHLASASELVSKHFHSKSGRAYLFHTCSNVVSGPHENRIMTTGKHIVCDIFCVECMSCVGWQYIFAFEESQKYKEGMSILERAMVVDFDKTSPAASLARASLSLSTVSSASSGSGSDLALPAASPLSPAAPPPAHHALLQPSLPHAAAAAHPTHHAVHQLQLQQQLQQQYQHHMFQQAQLQLQQQQARMLLGAGIPYHQLQAVPLMMQAAAGGGGAALGLGLDVSAGGMVLFAADDSGSDEEE